MTLNIDNATIAIIVVGIMVFGYLILKDDREGGDE